MGELTAQVWISEFSNCKAWYENERLDCQRQRQRKRQRTPPSRIEAPTRAAAGAGAGAGARCGCEALALARPCRRARRACRRLSLVLACASSSSDMSSGSSPGGERVIKECLSKFAFCWYQRVLEQVGGAVILPRPPSSFRVLFSYVSRTGRIAKDTGVLHREIRTCRVRCVSV